MWHHNERKFSCRFFFLVLLANQCLTADRSFPYIRTWVEPAFCVKKGVLLMFIVPYKKLHACFCLNLLKCIVYLLHIHVIIIIIFFHLLLWAWNYHVCYIAYVVANILPRRVILCVSYNIAKFDNTLDALVGSAILLFITVKSYYW